ncbi:hypothetical protein CFN78_18135 [Amycolatopsis antarctica]|uniref:Sugar kinase n=1 Tax=Amycolatopsis antarctica TaxID=1854586 RepID=A0A263D071_9PSEU|nr:ROK family transcriptional regulator [Amycolatopsis antarctica]OZM71751.1 hypothetical protein CFN78_18135 [Amycolatopsis antarctica]
MNGTADGRGNASQASLREVNLALIATTAFAAPEPRSRAELAQRTALSRATVSRLVDELVRGEVLAEQERSTAGARGRPAVPLVPSPARFVALGLQVNTSRLTARVVDLTGATVAQHSQAGDLVGSDPAEVLGELGSIASRLMARLPRHQRLAGAGLALPGIVSTPSGRLLRAPNLGWAEVDAAEHLRTALGPVRLQVGNEADLAALSVARARPGVPGANRDFIYVSGEIGIGGAAVRDGAVLRGSHGWAGEIGHVCVDPNGPACRCGANGCLESFAGRRVLLAGAGLPPDGSPHDVLARAGAGDPGTLAALERAADALGTAVSSAVHLLDLPAVVLGGDLAVIGPLIRDRVEGVLARRVISNPWAAVDIVIGSGDPSDAATGAALAELERVVANPAAYLS